MNGKIIEVFCALSLGLNITLYLLVQFQIIEPWYFPAVPVFVLSVILGCVGATFGIGLWIMRKHKQYPARTDTMVIFLMCFVPFTFIQVGYGWQNINLKASNDYSTDLVNPPLFYLSKYERLVIKEVAPFWGFLDIPHVITKAERDSLVFAKSGLELKRMIIKAANNLGWRMIRRSANTSTDNTFNETYEIAGGYSGIAQRTDLVVRVVSNNGGSAIVDIRVSFPSRRRDLGFSEEVLQKFARELEKLVTSNSIISFSDTRYDNGTTRL